MLIDHLRGNIRFKNKVTTWEAAVQYSAKPLLDKEMITEKYVEAIIENTKENGPYYILVPGVAVPHARHEMGAIENGLSCLVLDEPILFPNNKEAKVLMTLSSEGNDGHLDMLSELGMSLIESEKVEKLKVAKNEEDVLDVFE